MPVNADLRSLDIAIPAKPQALVELSLLLADEDVNLDAVARLIEGDMALAAAVLKAVNSSLYGLRGRVQTVQQAITYLGTREVVGIAYEMGLRAAFGPADELEPLWQRAALRGLVMSRLAQKLSLDAWAAHSAGLFEECGKAVLFRHARHHIAVQSTGKVPPELARRSICIVSGVADAMINAPDRLEAAAGGLAVQGALEPALVLRAARQVMEQLDDALLQGAAA